MSKTTAKILLAGSLLCLALTAAGRDGHKSADHNDQQAGRTVKPGRSMKADTSTLQNTRVTVVVDQWNLGDVMSAVHSSGLMVLEFDIGNPYDRAGQQLVSVSMRVTWRLHKKLSALGDKLIKMHGIYYLDMVNE
jgi:hypothetical protein